MYVYKCMYVMCVRESISVCMCTSRCCVLGVHTVLMFVCVGVLSLLCIFWNCLNVLMSQ